MNLIKRAYLRLREDIETVFKKDPAARNTLEVITCYPGLHAIISHRFSHFLWRKNFRLIARLLSHISRFFTGVEIHPGATIGKRFFIDHGMGVVIGETTEIGDDVLIYQGVVLGGVSLEKKKRHPTLGNHVVIGAGATILGAVNIGENAMIGAGSVVVKDVPAKATAVGVPARIGLGFTPDELDLLEHGKLPDPIAEAIKFVVNQQDELSKRVKILEEKEGVTTQKQSDEAVKKHDALIKAFTDGSGI